MSRRQGNAFMEQDYYLILGVTRQASQVEIKQAFRRMAKRFHPDVSTETDAELKFKQVNEAYDVLGNEFKKAAYDRKLHYAKQQSRQYRQRPNNSRYADNRQSYNNASPDWKERQQSWQDLSSYQPESWWQSRFKLFFKQKPKDRFARVMLELEDVVAGIRKRIRLPDGEQLYVKIPEGIEEGKKIRIVGKGYHGGDLLLTVRFKEHKLFRLKKQDVYLDINVSPWEAALGTEIIVPTLYGEQPVVISPNTQAGSLVCIVNKGLPGKAAGSQFLVVHIHTPPVMSQDDRDIYMAMQNWFETWNPREESRSTG